jgi:hypothetical protein
VTLTVEEASELLECDMSKEVDWYGVVLKAHDFELDGDILTYAYGPEDHEAHKTEVTIYQVNLVTGEERHCGICDGCFFTEWEESK